MEGNPPYWPRGRVYGLELATTLYGIIFWATANDPTTLVRTPQPPARVLHIMLHCNKVEIA
jgi:hypothetical protein